MATEDYTTYTKLDPNSRFAVTAGKIAVVDLGEQEDAWVYDDKGAAHFGATFEHHLNISNGDASQDAELLCWAASNVIEDHAYWVDNNSQAVYSKLKEKATDVMQVGLTESENAGADGYDFGNGTIGTPLWFEVERTSTTAIVLRIYSDAEKLTLVDTLGPVTLTNGRTYRYVFGVNSKNSGAAEAFTIDIENLDLNEAAAEALAPMRALLGVGA